MKRKFQIFVSSTYTDLIAERQSAVSAILKAGHIPAGMELFTAGDKSQMDTIKKWIDESDAYMLILGGRYGSIEPKSGISYTELEYDYAIEQEKPFFAIVINDIALEEKIKLYGSSQFEKENPQALKLFKEKVLSNISSFFSDEKDIKLAVHESLAEMASNRDLKGWIQADDVVDPKPLVEEIKKLSEENQQLRARIAEQDKKSAAGRTASSVNYEELAGILRSIKIDVPANISADGEETSLDLFNILTNNRDTLISGITNQHGNSDLELFFYYNICPKLQVHELVVNEKVAGVQYRRYSFTKKGTALLADFDRRVFKYKERKKKDKVAESAN
ncbi:DUF4062 domain-containing protein [Pseudomonas sp. KCJK8670]|uniref:DUF4062 domain-containing protein n=1 Tax=Pseudomonas sp. KCJK8670 TaxID=3344558 RepID=UPI0039064529